MNNLTGNLQDATTLEKKCNKNEKKISSLIFNLTKV